MVPGCGPFRSFYWPRNIRSTGSSFFVSVSVAIPNLVLYSKPPQKWASMEGPPGTEWIPLTSGAPPPTVRIRVEGRLCRPLVNKKIMICFPFVGDGLIHATDPFGYPQPGPNVDGLGLAWMDTSWESYIPLALASRGSSFLLLPPKYFCLAIRLTPLSARNQPPWLPHCTVQ